MSALRPTNVRDLMADPTAEEMEALAELSRHPGYRALFDVMKRACLTMENDLINVPVEETRRVIAEHRKVQAAWQIVMHLDDTVRIAAEQWADRQVGRVDLPWTPEQIADNELLNPLQPYEVNK